MASECAKTPIDLDPPVFKCPVSGQELLPAPESLIQSMSQKLTQGILCYRSGASVKDEIDGGLVTADSRLFYPQHDGIQVLIAENAIELEEKKQSMA